MGKLCFKFGEYWSMNNVTFLSTDAGRTDGRTDVYVILYSVQCLCIALDRQLCGGIEPGPRWNICDFCGFRIFIQDFLLLFVKA